MSRCCASTRRTPTRSITSPWSPARRSNSSRASSSPAAPSRTARRRRACTICSARRSTGWASRWRRSRISTGRSRSTPNFADAHGNRANILVDAGFPDEALKSFDRALALNPASGPDWLNRGALLQELGRHADALASFDKAVICGPEVAEAHVNRANALKDLGHLDAASGLPSSPRFDEAAAAYSKAIALEPRMDEAYFGRGLLALVRGDWAAGFADYEHREKVGEPTFVALDEPRWDGELRAGERLVLVSEQGLGDAIQFCRFAPLLAARGFDVTILTRKAMAPLLSTLKGVTIATDAEALAQDPRPLRWAPLLSVPGVLGIRPDRVPADVPYLAAQPARVEKWRARLGEGGFKIGINWSSGHSDKAHFTRRDIALADFAPLAALPGVQLISLQKGAAAAQIGPGRVPRQDHDARRRSRTPMRISSSIPPR